MKSDEKPEPGDLIEISRVVYLHFAVYVGDGYVVHVTTAGGAASSSLKCSSSKKAIVRKQKLKEVVGNSTWKINNILDKMYEPRPADDIVEEALGQVGNVMEYSVTSENCEHFATKMRYGIPLSIQGMVVDAAAFPFRPVAEAAAKLFRN
ncbi:phospholipase A and acyltransferase 4-like isoform X2 [Sparus aurata]|uniref:Phospholipase A and acyltransferase 2-like n=1 Tax=Sparus aurata TaxID=8175 RepID=A0A671WT68_SPAAU|nr:phospholipase A and acyltransferase 4-like isoform X2 [Sparus aurata]